MDNPQGDALLRAACDAAHRVIEDALFAVAEPDVLLARYPSGSSLLWRDAGAFLTVAHLLAVSARAGSRVLGICVEVDASDRFVPAAAVGALALTGGPHVT